MKPPRLMLVGEFDPEKIAHRGIEKSLALAQEITGEPLEHFWVSSAEVSPQTVASVFEGADGLWSVPGSPYASTDGAIEAIRFARENELPFFGSCGGFQHALMEFAQHELGLDARHNELEPLAENALIFPLRCALVEVKAAVRADPMSGFSTLLGGNESIEEFHCSYGFNPAFQSQFAKSAVRFVAFDLNNELRAFIHSKHPFYVGVLFQPERKALSGRLHPLIESFFKAVRMHAEKSNK